MADRASVGFNRPFQEQVDFFRQKLALPSERWDDIWKSAHDRAFIVAGAAKADLLADLKAAVDRAISDGTGLEAFRRDFGQLVARNGWSGWTGEGSQAGRDWRTRVIFQTNMATSYAAGRWAQLNDPELAAFRPYWRYHHADGVMHPRPLHVAWNGMVLPRDHPFWRKHFPPNGWGCHCTVSAASAADYEKAQAAGKGGPPTGWNDKSEKTGELPGIDRGFGYAPGANTDVSLRNLVADKLITYPPAITRALSRDLSRYVEAADPPSAFAAKALTDRSISHSALLGFPDNFEEISSSTGFDVRGYVGLLPAEAPRHIERAHAHDGSGQRPTVLADYDRVWRVLTEADSIKPGHSTALGLDSILAVKEFDGERYRAVFEIRHGRKTRALALVSLIIKSLEW